MILNNLFKNKILKTAWGFGALLVGLFLFTFVDVAKADARYIPRSEWCNHAIDCDANRTWRPQYEYATHVMVHHTGEGNGYGDTLAKVRAIWNYHTYYVKNPDGSVGWGDVGYNFLIDAYGNVFEGRFGGEDVIGAHGNTYNRGSIGISIIGNYTNSDIPVAARDSLLELMAEKLGKKGIEPNSSAYYPSRGSSSGIPVPDAWGRFGVTAPRIDGHRTFNPTGCPGNAFYSTFPNLRIWASQRAVKYSKPWTILGSAIYNNELTAPIDYTNMHTGQTAIGVLIIRNNTNYTWTNFGPNAIVLGTRSPQDSPSPIANNWIVPWRAATMLESSVVPGQNATFYYGIKAPNSLGSYRTYLAPVIEGVTWLNHQGYNVPIRVTSTAPSEPAIGFKGEVVSSNLPSEMITEAVYNAEIKIKNTGGVTWTNSGSNPVNLGTSNPIDRNSPFYVQGNWLNAGRPAKLVESSVATGQIGTFRFQFKAPVTPGSYTENYNIVREGDQWGNLNISKTINIKGTYKAELQSTIPQENVLQGSEKIITLSFKNTGTATWQKSNTNLGTANPYDRLSPLANQSWLNPGRPARLNEDQVLPGGNGTFTFSINTNKAGTFNESFAPVVEGETWMPSLATIRFVISPPIYSYQFISQSASRNLANLSFGDQAELTLNIKNTGNVSWKNSGSNPINLGASNPRDRISPFFTSGNWLNAARPAKLTEAEVLPGQVATFTWTITAPRNSGEYREFYTPVVEGRQWMADATFNYYIKVDNRVSYQFISQASSKNLANLLPGEEASLGLTVKNTGSITWKKSGINTVNLGTSNPNDRPSSVYHSSWLNAGRPTSFDQTEVKPGEIATFEWVIKAPNAPGTNLREYYNLVMEGFTWMPAVNFNYYIAVSEGLFVLDGISIPAIYGKTAQEQHLYLNSEEAALGRTSESANLHYQNSLIDILFPGISAIKNGMAGGYGAFGSYANYNLPIEDERYYINMRWNYTEWYEAPDGTCTSILDGKLDTCTRNTDSNKKAWHYRKRVLVINPANGKKLVASVLESGPAIWTGRVSGLSPEGMYVLGAKTNDNLQYFWHTNQNAPVGLIN